MEVDSLVDAATMINGSFGLMGPELVSPDVFHLSGVVFDDSAKAKSQTVEFCGSKLKVWQPSSAVSDVSMAELNGDATFKGMLKELGGLSSCKAGNVMNKAQAEAYCHKHGIQVLASRWVTNEKTDTDGAEIVRSRLVVKDLRGSKSARSLEISSPTPSVEALRTVLAYAGRHDWELASLDVSQAFMHTPLKQTPQSMYQNAFVGKFSKWRTGVHGFIPSPTWVSSFQSRVVGVHYKRHSWTAWAPCL